MTLPSDAVVESALLNVTATALFTATWIAPLSGVTPTTYGGVKSAVLKWNLRGCSNLRPQNSTTWTVRVSTGPAPSRTFPFTVSVLPAQGREEFHGTQEAALTNKSP